MAAKKKGRSSKTAKPKRKAKPARKTKAKPRRKPKPVEKKVSTSLFGDLGLEDATSEPIADVSGMHRISEKITRAQRGLDEDEAHQFGDPSLVVDLELKKTLRGKISHETTQPVRDEDILSETDDD